MRLWMCVRVCVTASHAVHSILSCVGIYSMQLLVCEYASMQVGMQVGGLDPLRFTRIKTDERFSANAHPPRYLRVQKGREGRHDGWMDRYLIK